MRQPPAQAHPAVDDLTTTSPRVLASEAEQLALEHYGITGVARRLTGEKDDNFRLRSSDALFLFKVVHVHEPPGVTNLCTAVLQRLADADDLPVQRLVRSLTGELDPRLTTADGVQRTVRMTSYLEGQLLRAVPSSRQLRENLGRTLARLTAELASFTHPAASRRLLWDVGNAQSVRPLLDELTDIADEPLLRHCLDRFTAEIRPRLTGLRAQVVHNDLSADNILIGADDVTVTGILDFGDMVVTQIINDVAVAATSQLADGADPLAPVLDLVRGYHEILPLNRAELGVLYDLVRTRSAMRIIITEWRARRFPENRAYIMRNTSRSWEQLRNMPTSAAAEVFERLCTTCNQR